VYCCTISSACHWCLLESEHSFTGYDLGFSASPAGAECYPVGLFVNAHKKHNFSENFFFWIKLSDFYKKPPEKDVFCSFLPQFGSFARFWTE